MNRDELQKVWDDHLVYGFRCDMTVPDMTVRFVESVNPELFKDLRADKVCFEALVKYITTLNLKRCMDRVNETDIAFDPRKIPLRGFISKRSPDLSNLLFNPKNKPEEVLEIIGQLKWKRQAAKSRSSKSELKQLYNKVNQLRPVAARSLSKKHDWSTVK